MWSGAVLAQEAPRPRPNEPVTCALTITNRGNVPSLARVFLDVQSDPERGGDGAVEVNPGQTRTARMTFRWPHEDDADVTAGVEVIERAPQPRPLDGGSAQQMIFFAHVPIGGRPRPIGLPVDSSVRQLLVSLESLPGVTATVFRPNGARAGELDRDVSISTTTTIDLVKQTRANLRLYTIAHPQAGLWRLEIDGMSGTGAVLVKASGASPIAFDEFRFVRKQDGVHRGYFPIDGMPLAGLVATASARAENGPNEATFRLVDEAGTTLRTVPLRKGDPLAAEAEFVGTFELPDVPFHVVMTVDQPGGRIQRQFPGTFRAQAVAGLSPQSGPSGTVVTVTGTGFAAARPEFVWFNGQPVAAAVRSDSELTPVVPPEAAAGLVVLALSTVDDVAMSPAPFIVRAPRRP